MKKRTTIVVMILAIVLSICVLGGVTAFAGGKPGDPPGGIIVPHTFQLK